MKKAAIIGAGKFGVAVARRLAEGDIDVLLVEHSSGLLDDLKDVVNRAVVGDSTDIEVLRDIGVGDVDVAVVTMGEHFEPAVLTVAALRDLGVKRIVARANNVREERILRLVGAHRVVFIESETGRRLAEELISPQLTEQMNLPEGYSVLKIKAPERMAGQTLKDLDLRSWYNVLVVAISRGPNAAPDTGDAAAVLAETNMIPPTAYKIRDGDVLVVLGKDDDLARMMAACRKD